MPRISFIFILREEPQYGSSFWMLCTLLQRVRDVDKCAKCYQHFYPFHCNLFLILQWSGCCSFSTGLQSSHIIWSICCCYLIVFVKEGEPIASQSIILLEVTLQTKIISYDVVSIVCKCSLVLFYYEMGHFEIHLFSCQFFLTCTVTVSIYCSGRQAHLWVS